MLLKFELLFVYKLSKVVFMYHIMGESESKLSFIQFLDKILIHLNLFISVQ